MSASVKGGGGGSGFGCSSVTSHSSFNVLRSDIKVKQRGRAEEDEWREDTAAYLVSCHCVCCPTGLMQHTHTHTHAPGPDEDVCKLV